MKDNISIEDVRQIIRDLINEKNVMNKNDDKKKENTLPPIVHSVLQPTENGYLLFELQADGKTWRSKEGAILNFHDIIKKGLQPYNVIEMIVAYNLGKSVGHNDLKDLKLYYRSEWNKEYKIVESWFKTFYYYLDYTDEYHQLLNQSNEDVPDDARKENSNG